MKSIYRFFAGFCYSRAHAAAKSAHSKRLACAFVLAAYLSPTRGSALRGMPNAVATAARFELEKLRADAELLEQSSREWRELAHRIEAL